MKVRTDSITGKEEVSEIAQAETDMPQSFVEEHTFLHALKKANNIGTIAALVEKYPKKTAEIFECVKLSFSKLVTHMFDLIRMSRIFPMYHESMFLSFREKKNFEVLVKNSRDVMDAAMIFPVYKNALGDLIFKPKNFNRIITNVYCLCNIVSLYPERSQALFHWLVDPANFQRLNVSARGFNQLAAYFPAYKEILYDHLSRPGCLERVVEDVPHVEALLQAFPEGRDVFFKFLCVPDHFENIVYDCTDFKKVMTMFEGKKYALLTLFCLRENFNRFVKKSADIGILKACLPEYSHIFTQETDIQPALKNSLMESKEASQYTRGALAGMLRNSKFFKKIPRDPITYISGFLNRIDGAQIAKTCKAAHIGAHSQKISRKS